jgi:hypothetical protein
MRTHLPIFFIFIFRTVVAPFSQMKSVGKGKSSLLAWKHCVLCVLLLLVIFLPLFLLKVALQYTGNSFISASSKWFHHLTEITLEPISINYDTVNITPFPESYSENHKEVDVMAEPADSYSQQASVIEEIENTLKSHPLSKLTAEQTNSFQLEDYFVYLSSQSECRGLPVITSMANIFSELYWQL